MTDQPLVLLQGICALACGAIGLIFFRVWSGSRDRFFVYFAVGFALMAVSWILLGLSSRTADSRPYIYGIRLLAFLLITIAIVDKNRTPESEP
jgi:hypothetical protein